MTSALPEHVRTKIREGPIVGHDGCANRTCLRANESIKGVAVRAGKLPSADRRDRVDFEQSEAVYRDNVGEVVQDSGWYRKFS